MIKGIGVDIVKHERVDIKIAKRLLSADEYQKFERFEDVHKIEYLASRFAAKEAIIKATNKKFSFSDIKLANEESGKIICTSIENMHVSISHEVDYSIAFAVWEENK